MTTEVATWGAAFHGDVAQAAADQEEQLRWRRMITGPLHLSLAVFLLGFLIVGFSVLLREMAAFPRQLLHDGLAEPALHPHQPSPYFRDLIHTPR